MHSNDYEAAFGRFLEQTEYDEAEDALFSLVRAAFQAGGWLRAARKARLCGCLRCCGQRTSGKNHRKNSPALQPMSLS